VDYITPAPAELVTSIDKLGHPRSTEQFQGHPNIHIHNQERKVKTLTNKMKESRIKTYITQHGRYGCLKTRAMRKSRETPTPSGLKP
jgi:hypothetical protein